MTLGEFFREYVFYPISTTKLFLRINTKARKCLGSDAGRLAVSCLPIMCVWILTGLWHGASMNYIAWGVYHGVLLCLSAIFGKPLQTLREKLHINGESIFWRLFQMLRTFILCMGGCVFFLTNSLGHSRFVFASILKYFGDFEQYSKFVIPETMLIALLPTCFAVLAVSIVQEYYSEKGEEIDLRAKFLQLKLPIRWLILLVGLVYIFLFGRYGNGYTVFKTFKECSKDDNNHRHLVESPVLTINFDKLTEWLYERGHKPKSADSMSAEDDYIYFIEFKSGDQTEPEQKKQKLIAGVSDKINKSDETLYTKIYAESGIAEEDFCKIRFFLVVENNEIDAVKKLTETYLGYFTPTAKEKYEKDIIPELKNLTDRTEHFDDIDVWYSSLFDTYLKKYHIENIKLPSLVKS